MIVRQTRNPRVIKWYLTHPDIVCDAFVGSEIDPKTYDPPLGEAFRYYEAYDPRRLGLICYNRFRDGWKIHPYLLREFRGVEDKQFMREALDIFPIVYAEIDANNRRLIRYARKLGFKEIERGERIILRFDNGICK